MLEGLELSLREPVVSCADREELIIIEERGASSHEAGDVIAVGVVREDFCVFVEHLHRVGVLLVSASEEVDLLVIPESDLVGVGGHLARGQSLPLGAAGDLQHLHCVSVEALRIHSAEAVRFQRREEAARWVLSRFVKVGQLRPLVLGDGVGVGPSERAPVFSSDGDQQVRQACEGEVRSLFCQRSELLGVAFAVEPVEVLKPLEVPVEDGVAPADVEFAVDLEGGEVVRELALIVDRHLPPTPEVKSPELRYYVALWLAGPSVPDHGDRAEQRVLHFALLELNQLLRFQRLRELRLEFGDLGLQLLQMCVRHFLHAEGHSLLRVLLGGLPVLLERGQLLPHFADLVAGVAQWVDAGGCVGVDGGDHVIQHRVQLLPDLLHVRCQ